MKNSAKNPTPSLSQSSNDRAKLVAEARKFVREGGSKAAFARAHAIPRTTVVGWCQGNDGPRGRPLKLETFNESAILELLFSKAGFQDKNTVRDCIQIQSGEVLQKRSLFRYFEKWGLSGKPANSANSFSVDVADWIQPSETVDPNSSPLQGKIWRLSSGRGMEGFMLTHDDACATIAMVAAAAVDLLKEKRKRLLSVNHPALAVILSREMKDWQVAASSSGNG